MSTVYLVTGANRGIGLGLVKLLAGRPDVFVYAAARNPTQSSALVELSNSSKNVKVLKVDVVDEQELKAAAQLIANEFGRIDVIFANAGISEGADKVADTSLETYQKNFGVNTLGTVATFLATYKLLEKSNRSEGGVFFVVSTVLASISSGVPFINAAGYGASKAALNYIVKRIAIEHDQIIALAVHPGLVNTPLGHLVSEALGKEFKDIGGIPVEESVNGLTKIADAATKADSGTFRDYTGKPIGW